MDTWAYEHKEMKYSTSPQFAAQRTTELETVSWQLTVLKYFSSMSKSHFPLKPSQTSTIICDKVPWLNYLYKGLEFVTWLVSFVIP